MGSADPELEDGSGRRWRRQRYDEQQPVLNAGPDGGQLAARGRVRVSGNS
jgi:hypothetical protein